MNRSDFFKTMIGAICTIPFIAQADKPKFTSVDTHVTGKDLMVRNSAGEVLPVPGDSRPVKITQSLGDGNYTGDFWLYTNHGGKSKLYINNVEQKNWKGFPSMIRHHQGQRKVEIKSVKSYNNNTTKGIAK